MPPSFTAWGPLPSPLTPPDRHGASPPTLYISDRNANDVVAVDGVTFQYVETITGFTAVYGISTDTSGNLYVADGGAGVVDVFPPRGTTPSLVLKLTNGGPDRLRVRMDGTVYVGDDQGDLEVFPAGATSPSQVVQVGGNSGLAFDAYDDVFYGSQFYYSKTNMFDSRGGNLNARIELPVHTKCPYSTSFDTGGTMLVADWCAFGTAVAVFPPEATVPSATFDVGSSPFEIILNTDSTLAFVGRDTPAAGVDVFAYPALTLVTSILGPPIHVDDVAFGPAGPDPTIPHGPGAGILLW
jgi:hypothetical protein